jgi:transglutaminase-like putative cysteine protease
MDEFLAPTAVIDCHTDEIQSLAAELARDATDDEAIARRCFFWVRDQVRHTADYGLPEVTCSASEVLRYRSGLCYAKSHLLVALLRARRIPAALCYQRLALDAEGKFCLHGLAAVHLTQCGWYRIDPRGDKPGIKTDFAPPVERLAFAASAPGEADIPGRYADALPVVVTALKRFKTAAELLANLPDALSANLTLAKNPPP